MVRVAMITERFLALARAYIGSTGLALSTLGRLAGGHGSFFTRAAQGRVTVRRVEEAIQWFSNNWPAGLPWPEDIPRPDPTSRSRIDEPPRRGVNVPPMTPLQAVDAAQQEMLAAMTSGDWVRVELAEQRAFRAGMALRPDGRVASPAALCRALDVSRDVYRDVVRRFAYQRGVGRRTRDGSDSDRMLKALAASGDIRFDRYRPGQPASAGDPQGAHIAAPVGAVPGASLPSRGLRSEKPLPPSTVPSIAGAPPRARGDTARERASK